MRRSLSVHMALHGLYNRAKTKHVAIYILYMAGLLRHSHVTLGYHNYQYIYILIHMHMESQVIVYTHSTTWLIALLHDQKTKHSSETE